MGLDVLCIQGNGNEMSVQHPNTVQINLKNPSVVYEDNTTEDTMNYKFLKNLKPEKGHKMYYNTCFRSKYSITGLELYLQNK